VGDTSEDIMNATHTGGTSNFGAREAGETMWQLMDQLRSTVEKKVHTRMGKGDVRAAVLALLHEEPMHGYQIIREIGIRTGGRWKPSAGSVYPTLQLLADEGLVKAKTTADRKTYSLTEDGKVQAEAAAASAPWDSDDASDSAFGVVPKAGVELAQAVAHVVRSGTTAQQEQVADVLHETRRKIYSILAQD
jgi:DNA-binding PadR family transcriptional regulator